MNHISNMTSSADMTLKPPGNFTPTGDLSVGWKRWVERFDCYIMATERDKKTGGIQPFHLLWEDSAMLQLLREDYSFTYPPLSELPGTHIYS